MSIRQAPQGEESHSPSSPRFDPKQLPMLARLMTPVSADKVVTTGAAPVYISESVPIRRSSVTSPQQLPPKSPKPARSSVVSTSVGGPGSGPRPQLVAIGRSRSSSGSSNRPCTPSTTSPLVTAQLQTSVGIATAANTAVTSTATPVGGTNAPAEQVPSGAELASSCPVTRPSVPYGGARTRMQHPYVNDSPSWGLTSGPSTQNSQQASQHPQQSLAQSPPLLPGVVQVAASAQVQPLSLTGTTGLTRSHPNLVNDYVNLDPKSCAGVNPDRCQPISVLASGVGANSLGGPGLCPHRCTRIPHSDEVCQLTAQLHSAMTRLNRLEMVDRELARMQDAHECLVRSVERQHQLEAAVRRAFEREVSQLRQENGQLKDKLHHTLLCLNRQQQQQQQQTQPQQPQGQQVPARGGVNASGSSTACLDSDLLKLLIGEKESRISKLEQENQRLREQLSSPSLGLAMPSSSSRETTPLSMLAPGHAASSSTSFVNASVPTSEAYNIDILCDQLKMSMLSVGNGPGIAALPTSASPPGVVTASSVASASAHVT